MFTFLIFIALVAAGLYVIFGRRDNRTRGRYTTRKENKAGNTEFLESAEKGNYRKLAYDVFLDKDISSKSLNAKKLAPDAGSQTHTTRPYYLSGSPTKGTFFMRKSGATIDYEGNSFVGKVDSSRKADNVEYVTMTFYSKKAPEKFTVDLKLFMSGNMYYMTDPLGNVWQCSDYLK